MKSEMEIQTGLGRDTGSLSRGGGRLTWMFSLWLAVVVYLPLSVVIRSMSWSAPREARQVTVNPGNDISALVQQNPPGTEFRIRAGMYRLQSVSPKDSDSFVGEPGTTLNGAQLLTGFLISGQVWAASVRATQHTAPRGTCTASHPVCTYPEDLFIDDKPLLRVASLNDVGPGKWYLDYDANKAYLGDDPAGHTVEMSLAPTAIKSGAANVRIEGLTIEKYASGAGDGAVEGRFGRNWVVENNVLRLNHGMGIRLGDGMQVLGNKILENGQMGLGGGGSNVVVDGNEVARNNYAGYAYGWEAGGSKFAFSNNLVVRNNYVHDNDGPGLWTDIENHDTLYENNHTVSNREAGILHEISYHAIIRNNLIENEGFNEIQKTDVWYGAGIIVVASSDVEVYGNTVTNCMNGIVGTQPQRELSRNGTPYLLQNFNVHDNIITQSQGVAAGIVRAGALGDEAFVSRNNRFANNHYHLADPRAKFFAWNNARLSYEEWKAETHE